MSNRTRWSRRVLCRQRGAARRGRRERIVVKETAESGIRDHIFSSIPPAHETPLPWSPRPLSECEHGGVGESAHPPLGAPRRRRLRRVGRQHGCGQDAGVLRPRRRGGCRGRGAPVPEASADGLAGGQRRREGRPGRSACDERLVCGAHSGQARGGGGLEGGRRQRDGSGAGAHSLRLARRGRTARCSREKRAWNRWWRKWRTSCIASRRSPGGPDRPPLLSLRRPVASPRLVPAARCSATSCARFACQPFWSRTGSSGATHPPLLRPRPRLITSAPPQGHLNHAVRSRHADAARL